MSKALEALHEKLNDGLVEKVADLLSAVGPNEVELVEQNMRNAENIVEDTIKYLEAKRAEVPKPEPV